MSRSTVCRWAGGLYLAYILANALASRVGHIGLSDSQTLRVGRRLVWPHALDEEPQDEAAFGWVAARRD